jgi:hypothetical protein
VSTCGDQAYCACSESNLASKNARGRKSKEGWRSALSTSLDLGTRTSTDLCTYCNRHPLPPREDEDSSERAKSTAADKTLPLRHKLSRYLRLFRSGWKDQPDSVEQKPLSAARLQQQQNGSQKPRAQPAKEEEINKGDGGSTSETESSGPNQPGVSRSRLARANALLERARHASAAAG